jgi:pimeloyl-ACP methyl ester carboxylesterase
MRLHPKSMPPSHQPTIAAVSITVAPDTTPPFAVEATVAEEDTALVLSVAPRMDEPRESIDELAREIAAAPTATPGGIIIGGGSPLRLLAIIHDLDQDPSWRDAWIASALAGVFRETEQRGLASIALPLLGTLHGSCQATDFLRLFCDALDDFRPARLIRLWLMTPPGTENAVARMLQAEIADRANEPSITLHGADDGDQPVTANSDAHRDARYISRDGLSLYYRDFGDPSSTATALLCLPGLTRNSKDFVALAKRYAPGRRVLCPDLRGRGLSDYDPQYRNYRPATFVEDVWELLAHAGVERCMVIGTSLGGLMAMIMAHARPDAVAGVVLNDVGPEVDPVGLARLCVYVGHLPPVQSWEEAVAQSRLVYELALPDLGDREWLGFTRRQYREDRDGRIILEYDPRIGDALRQVGGVPQDPWVLFESLRDVPTLVTRGEISDVLSQATFDRMAERNPDLKRVLVSRRGHVPLLDEPDVVANLDAFVNRL